MSYTDFVKPYVDGWENGESGNTPITAEILNNNYDAFLIALNTWASGVPEDSSYVHTDNNYTSTEKTKLNGIATGATATAFNRVVASGTKLGTLTINGTDYDIYAPNAGAGSLSALSDVTLSSPSNGQVLEYDGTAGKWKNADAPTVPDEITDLNDVSVSSLQNGQILKWNSTSSKWENTNESGGGGGTTVVANPSGAATEELEKLQVGNTIYSIPEGGGSGSGFRRTNLYTATSDLTTIPLSDSIANYDLIEVICWYYTNDTNYTQNAFYNAQDLIDSIGGTPHRFVVCNDSMTNWFDVTDVDELTSANATFYIKEVYGYKFSSSNSIFTGKTLVMKTKTYTGTGTASFSLTFDEKPYAIFNIFGDGLNQSNKVLALPFMYGETTYMVASFSNSGMLFDSVSYSNNDLTITITGVDQGAAFNNEGSSYTIWYLVEENFNEFTEVSGILEAGETEITLYDSHITGNSTVEPFISKFGLNPTDMVVGEYSYTYSSFMDGKIVVRENDDDNTDIKLFICGLTKTSSDITITNNDLLAYLSDITSGYLKACETFDTADSTTQTGILAISNTEGTMLLRTYIPGWTQYKAGTFYGVIDLNESPVAAQGSPEYQENEYSDPYDVGGSVTLTFPAQSSNVNVKVRVS